MSAIFTVGYVGPQMMPKKFVDNPLDSAVDTVVRLSDTEVAPYLQRFGVSTFAQLNAGKQRAVARDILSHRTDEKSFNQLRMLGLNNPNFNRFEVVSTGGSLPTRSSGMMDHFLL